MMSKAKWFVVRRPSTGEMIATSANQVVPPKFIGGTKILYYIHQTPPLSSWRVEGGPERDYYSSSPGWRNDWHMHQTFILAPGTVMHHVYIGISYLFI